MDTKLTSVYPISEEKFKKLLIEEIKIDIDVYMNSLFEILCEKFDSLFENKYIHFNNNCVWNREFGLFIPNLKHKNVKQNVNIEKFDEREFLAHNILLKTISSQLPEITWARASSEFLKEVFCQNEWILCKCNDARFSGYGSNIIYNVHKEKYRTMQSEIEKGDIVITFPVVKIEKLYSTSRNFLRFVCISNEIWPWKLDDVLDEFVLCCKLKEYIKMTDGKMKYDDRLIKEFVMGEKQDFFESLNGELVNILNEYLKKRRVEGVTMQTKEELLNCEKIRADIEPYEERILTDPNRGHWDLWLNDEANEYTVKMENNYMARNPKCDINEEGVIAIDFGTKSTIVVYQSDIEHSLPMGIGDGNLSKEPTPKRYENPTVMQFVNLEKFLEAYRSKEGRPQTVWSDLPISHTAMDKFKNSKSEEYYAFLHQIKQWAGQREKQFRIQPINGESLLLPAFMDLKEDDINPIEIYAYYIGLYINNMRKGHGIFLDYYLSFPVTYETKVRKKIVDSFTKGLKKSLPISIQRDPEVMSRFKVNGDISEPAAYAVCALQEYGFEPNEDEEIFYGIFDFGGGTTDFDFGLWKCSTKRRYDYCIENFGAGGDEYLGGENLLEMLAFEIFKENQNIMREGNYTFALAPKSKEFLGSDALLSDSQEAEKNMHNLMEILRPYWEQSNQVGQEQNENVQDYIDYILQKSKTSAYYDEIEEAVQEVLVRYETKTIDKTDMYIKLENIISKYAIPIENQEDEIITLKVALFDKEGNDHPNVELRTTREFIDSYIEAKIREGVKNFFAALILSYQNEKVKKPTTVNILMAGNSCKSPIVKKVFEEEIAVQEKAIRKRFNLKDEVNFFEIFPPLGTKEAYKKMEERGLKYDENNFERPTGKTGVAFGLIQCRNGGTIERIQNMDSSSEIPFQYFLGWQSKKKFVLFKDESKLTRLKGKPDYNEWYKFIEADQDTFYLYYTSLPECVNGDLLIDGNAAVKRIKCNIDTVNDEAYVYIKAISPHTIQYAVSTDYDVDKNHIGKIYTKELG